MVTILSQRQARSGGRREDGYYRGRGIATGYTFRASLESLRQRRSDRLVAATPVAARGSAEMLKAFADEVVCLRVPASFSAVGAWYRNFDQVSDEEAAVILRRNWSRWSLAA